MLQIKLPAIESNELWDEANERFIGIPAQKEQILCLEHSLISISKWESKWCKPFFSKDAKTYEETVDYVRCMTITQNVKPEVYACLTEENINAINEYIQAPMTATTFSTPQTKTINGEQVTAELIYYWMVALNIPFECEKWHINRLITLVQVCNIKNQPPKKMSKNEIRSRNAALNAARRKRLNSKG